VIRWRTSLFYLTKRCPFDGATVMCSDVQSHESSYPADLDLAWDLSLTALWLLHRAADYAGNAGRSPWDFAIGVQQLRAAGFSDGDLRWLCCKGYAEHAFDTSRPGGQQRTFEHAATLAFDGRSSFVLTTSGIQLVRQLEVERDSLQLPSGKIPDKVARCDPDATPGTPHWDVLLRDLLGRASVGQALFGAGAEPRTDSGGVYKKNLGPPGLMTRCRQFAVLLRNGGCIRQFSVLTAIRRHIFFQFHGDESCCPFAISRILKGYFVCPFSHDSRRFPLVAASYANATDKCSG